MANYVATMSAFSDEAGQAMADLECQIPDTLHKLTALYSYFGEKCDDDEPFTILATLFKFLTIFDKAVTSLTVCCVS